MLPGAVVLEWVEPVALEIAQFVQRVGGVEQRQPAHCALLHIDRKSLASVTIPDAFGFGVGERTDHLRMSNRYQLESLGRLACQKRKPFTFEPVILFAAADGLG